MKIAINFLFCCFLFYIKGNTQSQHRSFSSHFTIIKNPKKVAMPEIMTFNFCQKLNMIIIPDSIRFKDDDGKPLYYYIRLDIKFGSKYNAPTIKSLDTNRAIKAVEYKIIELLKASKWKVPKSSKKVEIIFSCKLEERKFKNSVLKTLNNYQRTIICK